MQVTDMTVDPSLGRRRLIGHWIPVLLWSIQPGVQKSHAENMEEGDEQ